MSALQVQALSDGPFLDDTDACHCGRCGWMGFVHELEEVATTGVYAKCPQCQSVTNGVDGGSTIIEGHGPFDWWEPETAAEGGA